MFLVDQEDGSAHEIITDEMMDFIYRFSQEVDEARNELKRYNKDLQIINQERETVAEMIKIKANDFEKNTRKDIEILSEQVRKAEIK